MWYKAASHGHITALNVNQKVVLIFNKGFDFAYGMLKSFYIKHVIV